MSFKDARFKAWSAVGLTAVMVLTSCDRVDSAAESVGVSDDSKEQQMRVDLGPGVTYQEQIEEIEKFVAVMEERLGSGHVLRDDRTDTWTPEHHEEYRWPIDSCSDVNSFRQELVFEYSGPDAEQALAAGYEMAEDLGFATNEETIEDGTGERPMRFVASGEAGRSLIIRQQAGDESIIEVFYNTSCSEHESLHEAYDRIMGEIREERREERQREREELRDEIRSE